jgi:hypothetical protein
LSGELCARVFDAAASVWWFQPSSIYKAINQAKQLYLYCTFLFAGSFVPSAMYTCLPLGKPSPLNRLAAIFTPFSHFHLFFILPSFSFQLLIPFSSALLPSFSYNFHTFFTSFLSSSFSSSPSPLPFLPQNTTSTYSSPLFILILLFFPISASFSSSKHYFHLFFTSFYPSPPLPLGLHPDSPLSSSTISLPLVLPNYYLTPLCVNQLMEAGRA